MGLHEAGFSPVFAASCGNSLALLLKCSLNKTAGWDRWSGALNDITKSWFCNRRTGSSPARCAFSDEAPPHLQRLTERVGLSLLEVHREGPPHQVLNPAASLLDGTGSWAEAGNNWIWYSALERSLFSSSSSPSLSLHKTHLRTLPPPTQPPPSPPPPPPPAPRLYMTLTHF